MKKESLIITTRGIENQVKVKAELNQEHSLNTRSPIVQATVNAGLEVQAFNNFWHLPPQGVKRPFTELIDSKPLAGKRVFCLAGGPSLKGFDFSLLNNEFTIGINRVYEVFNSNILFAMDIRFYNWIKQGKYGEEALKAFNDYKNLKVWVDLNNTAFGDDNIFYLRSGQRYGYSTNLKNFYHGNNSGYGAIQLAIALGSREIYLLGYDMGFNQKQGEKIQTHWHDGHPTQATSEKTIKCFMAGFNRLSTILEGTGIKIINLNPKSNIRVFPFEKLKNLHFKIKRPVIISYYTDSYEEPARRLQDSIWKHLWKSDIERISSKGNWHKNINYKPTFIKKMLKKYPGQGVCWVDADGVLKSYPHKLENISQDVALHFREKKGGNLELMTGTIFFNNTKKAKELLDLWESECKANPGVWDQRNLQNVIKKWDGELKHLNVDYCCIFDSPERQNCEPVIEHFQHSRKIRAGEFYQNDKKIFR